MTASSFPRCSCRSLVTMLVLVLVAVRLPAHGQEASRDSWYRIEFEGDHVGYEHIRVLPVDDKGHVTCHRKTSLKLKRLSTDLSVEASLWTTQDTSGRLLNFELQRSDGAVRRLHRSGEFDYSAGIVLLKDSAGRSREKRIRLDDSVYSPIVSSWGLGVVDQYQRRRSQLVFFPEAGASANVVFEFRSNGLLKVGRQRVLTSRFSFYPEADTEKRTYVWSENGVLLRQEKIVFGGTLAIVRSTPEAAIAGATAALDLDARAMIPVTGLLGFKQDGESLVVELTVEKGSLPVIPSSNTQVVKEVDARTVQLTLKPPEYPQVQSVISARSVTIEPSEFFPLRDPTILNLASRGAGTERIPVRVCRNLERFVAKNMRSGPFSTSMLPADQVARRMRGDCTEYATLLCALIRARGIPSRIASGLVLTAAKPVFVGHTWSEAFIDGQWHSFDAAAGMGHVRIKLADSEMRNGDSSVRLFLPIIELAGQAKISVARPIEE